MAAFSRNIEEEEKFKGGLCLRTACTHFSVSESSVNVTCCLQAKGPSHATQEAEKSKTSIR